MYFNLIKPSEFLYWRWCEGLKVMSYKKKKSVLKGGFFVIVQTQFGILLETTDPKDAIYKVTF